MSNDQDPDATIRALEEQLEAAKAKAKIEAMEAELAALKAKDADAVAAAAVAEEAERARAAEAAAAAAAAAEAAQAAATADRAAALQAELDALRAKDAQVAAAAAAPVAAATPPAATPTATTPTAALPLAASAAPQEPAVIYVERPLKKKSGGLIAALVVILIAIVGTLGATYLAVRGDLRGPWAAPAPVPTDILLIGAGDFGPAPALTDSAALVTFDTLSLPADAATPEPVASLSVIPVVGDTPEIYGLSYAVCTSLTASIAEDAPAIEAYVAAMNADPTTGLSRAITAADYVAYTQNFTFGHLLADTRVTYNGFSAGASFPIQAVLQKGSLVAFDRFGVPRTHCGSGVPLTAPVAATGEAIFAGAGWGDLDLAEIVTITAAPEAQSSFTVLPVGPANIDTAFSVTSRACAWTAPSPCPDPSALSELQAPEKDAAAAVPVPAECSNWAAGLTDDDTSFSRVINTRDSATQFFMVDSAPNGCTARHDGVVGPGENRNIGYWPGSLILFTDASSATPIAEYVFGEPTLFVIQ